MARQLSICLAALIACSSAAQGQEAVDPLLEQRRIDEMVARTNALGGFEARAGAPDPGPAQAASGPCFRIDDLVVTGVTLISPGELAAVTAPFAPKCMQGTDIQGIMRAIDGAYAERGFITAKTYLPAQNIASGTLTLKVVEGRVEGIFLVDGKQQLEGRRARWQLSTAFPTRAGEAFNLRAFEQGLDQMNRLASVDATLRLQPGDNEGGSHVIVQRLQQDRFRGILRFDTLGSEINGRNRLSVDLAMDDLIGANDSWSLNLASTENTNALSLSGSIPWRSWTFGLDLGYSEYLTPLPPFSELFGTSATASLTARRILSRSQYSTTEIIAAVNWRNGDRFINDARLVPQRLASLDLGLSHIRLRNGSRNYFDAILGFGLDAFGATRDPATPADDEPRAQFVKLSAGWQRQARLWNLGTLVTDLRLQYSPVPLYGSEQLSLGSYSTVRGYAETAASGDSGAWMRADLYLSPETWTTLLPAGIRQEAASRMQPLVFLDAGFVHDKATGKNAAIAGLGIGLSWHFDRVTASGIVGLPLIGVDNRFDPGEPLAQIRIDLKTW